MVFPINPDADIVCSRAKNHYNPQGNLHLSETGTDASETLEVFKAGFLPLHTNQSRRMYFSVSLSGLSQFDIFSAFLPWTVNVVMPWPNEFAAFFLPPKFFHAHDDELTMHHALLFFD